MKARRDGTAGAGSRFRAMLYALSSLVVLMLLFMMWRAGFHMRRDRIATERLVRRGRTRRGRRAHHWG